MITQIDITAKGVRFDAIKKIVDDAIKAKYPRASVVARKIELPSSRAERFNAAKDKIEDASGDLQELHDEMESWFDNLPEGLQSSEKGDMIQQAVDDLDNMVNSLEEAIGTDVEFPGMYG